MFRCETQTTNSHIPLSKMTPDSVNSRIVEENLALMLRDDEQGFAQSAMEIAIDGHRSEQYDAICGSLPMYFDDEGRLAAMGGYDDIPRDVLAAYKAEKLNGGTFVFATERHFPKNIVDVLGDETKQAALAVLHATKDRYNQSIASQSEESTKHGGSTVS